MGFLEQCTPDQIKNLYEEFGATDATVERDIQTLKEWLEKQPHLPNVKDERIMRVIFIRSRNSLEKTKRFLETYYILKARYRDLFARADPTSEIFKRYYNIFTRLALPKLMPDLSRVFIFYFASPNNELVYDAEDFLYYSLTTLLLSNVMCGVQKQFIAIADFKYVKISRISSLLSVFQPFVSFSNTLNSVGKLYIINSSTYLEPIFKVGRQISKEIFDERLVFWKKGEKDLPEIIPKEYLPYEYGGTLGSREELSDLFLKEMEPWKDWLMEESKIYADLSKVPEDKKKLIEVGQFGVEGSFRKLELE